jgi:hypothetical protein
MPIDHGTISILYGLSQRFTASSPVLEFPCGGTYIPQLLKLLNLPFFRSFLARNAQLNPARVFALYPAS